MKKWTALLLAAVLSLSLTACGSTTAEETPATTAPVVETEPTIETTAPTETEPVVETTAPVETEPVVETTAPAKTEVVEETPVVETASDESTVDTVGTIIPAGDPIAIGDTVTTADYELTLTNVEFTYQITPPNTSGYYEAYDAESGMVFVHVEAQVKNLMKRDITIGELFLIGVIYDGQYTYGGMTCVNDGDARFDSVSIYSAATPLETCTAHGMAQCPEEVATSGKSVVVVLDLGSKQYNYTLQ